MEMKTQRSAGIIILLVLLLLVGYYIYRDNGNGDSTEDTATTTNSSATTTTIETTNGSTGYTIEQVPVQTLPPTPSLTRAIVYPAYFTSEQKSLLEKNINGNIALIQKNPRDVDAWVSLGNNRKIAADYEGALEAWNYAVALAPAYVVPLQNLADTYHFYLKNYTQSELYWKKAISISPQSLDLYKGLFDLYTLSYTEKASLAEQALLDGLKQTPTSIDFMIYLADYYKGSGRKDDARTYYTRARDEAIKMGDTARATLISETLATL